MAAFTEGFSNVSGGEGKGPQHLGKVIGMVLEARQLASDERREAQKKLSEQAPHLSLEDFGIDKGYFFKKALQHNFGGEFIDKKKESLKTLLSARRILKSKKKLYVTTRNFLRDSIKVDGGRASSFRKKFNYNLEVESPAGLEDSSKKVAKAASGGGPRTKQDFLTAVTEIAKSLQSTAQSINNAVDQNTGIASGIVSTQKNIVVEISHRTDRVTDKLEAIAAAVNQQTEFLKRAKTTATADKLQAQGELKRLDASFTNQIDQSGTKEDESMQLSTSEQTAANRSRTDITPKDPWMDMEKGGVIEINGSKGGYKQKDLNGNTFTAHGRELMVRTPTGGTQVIPVDNYATDGIQGNEVTPGGDLMAEKGMKIPPIPKLPDFSKLSPLSGLDLSKPFKAASSPITSTSSAVGGAQNMLDAMQLPFRAVGASLLKVTGDVRNRLGAVSPVADAKLNNMSNVLASSFGLSAQDVAPSKSSGEANARVRKSLEKQEKVSDSIEKNVNWRQAVRNFIGTKWDQTGNFINSTRDNVTRGVDNLLGRNKEFSQKEIATILIKEFKKQGLSDIGAQLATAEFMRESSLLQSNVLGSHMDGNERAWGAGSWQLDRDDALFKHLNEKYGITPENFANSGQKGIKGQASFMLEEIAMRGNKELLALLQKPSLNEEERTRVRQLFKEAYFRYADSIPLDRSEGALKEIHKLLGIETSNLQSSTRDIFSSDNFLEEFKVASNGSATEIVNLNLGADGGTAASTSFTDSLTSGSDTLTEGSEWPLEIATYYPQKLHV
jgi:hypothetical protein